MLVIVMNFRLDAFFMRFFLCLFSLFCACRTIKNINANNLYIYLKFFFNGKSHWQNNSDDIVKKKKTDQIEFHMNSSIRGTSWWRAYECAYATADAHQIAVIFEYSSLVLQLVIAFLSTQTKLRLIYQMNLSYISINAGVIHLIQLLDVEKITQRKKK